MPDGEAFFSGRSMFAESTVGETSGIFDGHDAREIYRPESEVRNHYGHHYARPDFSIARKNARPSKMEHLPGVESAQRLFENLAPFAEPDAIAIDAISVEQRIRERCILVLLNQRAKLEIRRLRKCEQAGSMSLS